MTSGSRHGAWLVAVLFCGLMTACGASAPKDHDDLADGDGGGDGDGDTVDPADESGSDATQPDTPTIVRVTNDVQGAFYGSALLFVVARGDELTYTWRKVGSTQVRNQGPEPFFLIGDLTEADDGDCYEVTASNDDGETTSEPMCINVGEVGYDFNANGGPIEPDVNVGQLTGNLMLALVRLSTAGPTAPLEAFWSELGPKPAANCGYSGSDHGAMLDGVPVTAAAPVPLGAHSLARTWASCMPDADGPMTHDGGILITYDFPDEVGVGTMTVHFSGFNGPLGGLKVNGSIDVTVSRDSAGASYDDQVIIAPRDELSLGDGDGVYKTDVDGYRTLVMTRSGTVSGNAHQVTTAEVDFASAAMSFYDAGGFTQVFAAAGPGLLTFNGNGTSSGSLTIWSSELGPPDEDVQHCVLVPNGDGIDWELVVD